MQTSPIDLLRTEAWKKALECCGTGSIFARRLNRLRYRQTLRDFLGIFVPAAVGIILSLELSASWTRLIVVIAAPFGIAQIGLSIMSLVVRWDDKAAPTIQSIKANNLLKSQWINFGNGTSAQTEELYKQLLEATEIQEALDLEQNISEREKRYGMHYGLREFRKACSNCGTIPTSLKPTDCSICGQF